MMRHDRPRASISCGSGFEAAGNRHQGRLAIELDGVGPPVALMHGAGGDDDVEASAGQGQCTALADATARPSHQSHSR